MDGIRPSLWVLLTYGGITAALIGLVAMTSYGRFFPVAILASSSAGIFIIRGQGRFGHPATRFERPLNL